ncbi:IclR family transcriptional regulator C-terminal domain-containing protein [Herbaspirillum huttiense]|jgi:IclR family pca regulon transcriptional regulator|uniref:IclR family transcriptional regulator domain-containing protein n=1 Tax=Herbaspirillum TaxID=963 RepID=UPI0003FC8F8C|nr:MULTISPECIES: IclR family transcriptional regulator C-terminal domain-containing protein [Herbaspirillum]MAF02397.1 4-hydroxyphenylpyruvate dioxygenase [Herbaspirillum sp.]MBO14677.1 4-hydroxyphenylpyruvate dioxygenase [Herbaspirillum sp.]MCO4855856.1 helix-turn-helix domain-containing protein [Herbaspirillum sp. WGmk3]MCP3657729.1 helix-turn-helix domain-containing protein [Herbaspirillum sp.]MCP3949901.1 helix-turn-helix domain-containing protein [Herbaspirillum sp.]|tara:strand:+ start:3000 stop:3812 length:813 start_codon:yes stop_codon:yes gene_type:complete
MSDVEKIDAPEDGSEAGEGGLARRDWIAGLEKGLLILEAFDYDNQRMTSAQVAARTGLSRTAARRYLLTLEHLGYLHSEGKTFALTPRVLKVGWSYFDSAPLPRILQPHLQQITGQTGEAVYASVLDGWDLVFIARNGTSRVMTTGFVLGARVPAQLASPGIVMLGALPEQQVREWLATCAMTPFTPHTITDPDRLYELIAQARQQGYALVEQQLQTGVRGIAVPLKNRHAKVVGALSLSFPLAVESQEQTLARVLPALQQAANALIHQV